MLEVAVFCKSNIALRSLQKVVSRWNCATDRVEKLQLPDAKVKSRVRWS